MTPEVRLDRGLVELRLDLSPEAKRKLLDYLALLAKWNSVYNLTAIRDPDKMVSNHLLDSLAVTSLLPTVPILDVGAGAGLPGIPLAIARPEVGVTLVDSSQKKAAFMQQAAAELGLANVTALHQRVEAWRPATRFPAIISRAFAELTDFLRLTRHLLAPGGAFYAMKGKKPEDEIKRLPPDFRVRDVIELTVPGLGAERCLIVIEATA